jgi:6-phosphogluconolactonase/glucosamine-6-phosphate isomerase/deaminase
MTPKISIYPDYQSMSLAAADRVLALLANKPNAVICLPSGSTPLGMFQTLAAANQKGMADFSKCVFIGLDEWIGMGADDNGSCRDLLDKDFLKPIGLRDNQIVFFDGKAIDPQAECDRVNKVVASLGGLDLIVLGVGMNGHLALNEPGTPWDTYAHISELETVTKEVGQKYFEKPTVLTKGITVGIRHYSRIQNGDFTRIRQLQSRSDQTCAGLSGDSHLSRLPLCRITSMQNLYSTKMRPH